MAGSTYELLFDFVEGKVYSRDEEGIEFDAHRDEVAKTQAGTEVTGSSLLGS